MNSPEMTGAPVGLEQEGVGEVFAFLGVEEQRRLLPLVTEVTIEQDMFLFEIGGPAREIFFLTRGRLSVQKQTGFHRKMQVVAILEPGTLLGEAGVLAGHVHGVSVRAIEPSHLYCLDCQKIESLERTDPQLIIQLFKRLVLISSLRLEKTTERLAHVL